MPFLLCFTLYLRAISKYSPPPGGASIWRGDLTEGFLRYEFGGLIFGGAYTWRGLFSEFYGSSYTANTATLGRISSEKTGTFSHHPPSLARTHFIASRTSLPSSPVSKWHKREGFFAGLLCCFYLLVSFSQLFFTSLYRRNHHEQTTLWSFPVE